ncbi:bifunctional demethylmenaquinone methyltransferase/2-methoxy-6-polyprenyl-1,4-benzoquinol methylase UbiE [Desulfatiferula olefinivorans]
MPFIREMFDTIAHRYDFLNRTLSLKQDVLWRRRMVRSLGLDSGRAAEVLDVACGTGDVALTVRRRFGEAVRVTGLDFSRNMLVLCREKVRSAGVGDIPLLSGNALFLPFGPERFDALTIAFGIRNIQDRERALAEFFRCLKPGGTLAVLELSTPENPLFHALYMFYFLRVLPFVGGLFSKNLAAYEYLPQSVIRFPDAKTFGALMETAGFDAVTWKKMTLGIVTLFTGKKKG